MKDFALSLLSRGCGHVVQTQLDSQGGRVEVCFEPEDYFSWKSNHPLLRLSDSGRIRCEVEPAPPKTYSTRRGPLLLYSSDLALPAIPDDDNDRKRHGCPQHIQRTLRDLTTAILTYDQKQLQGGSNVSDPGSFLPPSPDCPVGPPVSQLSHVWHPPTSPCDPQNPAGEYDIRDPGPACCSPALPDCGQIPHREPSDQPQTADCLRSTKGAIRDHPEDQPVTPNPSPCEWDDETGIHRHARPYPVPLCPLPPIPLGKVRGQEDPHPRSSSENQRILQFPNEEDLCFRIVVDAPRGKMSPISEAEVPHNETGCPDYLFVPEQCSTTGAGLVGDKQCPLKTAFVDTSWSCSRLSRVTYYGGHLNGSRLGTNSGGLDRKGDPVPDSHNTSSVHLPPLPSEPRLKSTPLVWSGPDMGGAGDVNQVRPGGPEKGGRAVRLPRLCNANTGKGAPSLTLPPIPEAPALRPSQSPEDQQHHRPPREISRKMLSLPLAEHDQSQRADTLRRYDGCHDAQAEDGMQYFCEEPGQKIEMAKIGIIDEDPSPRPVIEPRNSMSSPTLAAEHQSRGSSPTPATEPENIVTSASSSIQPESRECSASPLEFESSSRASSPAVITEPRKRISSPTPVIHPKEVNLGSLGTLDPGKEGVLPPLGGRKGPGKQCSMAVYRQDPVGALDDCDPDSPETSVVRGTLPVEMRERKNTTAVGTIIMAPDGEIVKLSFWSSVAKSNLQQHLDDITRGGALDGAKVMQDQSSALLLQRNTGMFASDSIGHQAQRNQSSWRLMDGAGGELPLGEMGTDDYRGLYRVCGEPDGAGGEFSLGQMGTEESGGLYRVCGEQGSQSWRPGELGPDGTFSHLTSDQQFEGGDEGVWNPQYGAPGRGQKGLKGLQFGEETSNDPSASAQSADGGNAAGLFSSNNQSAKTKAGIQSGRGGQFSKQLTEKNTAATSKGSKGGGVEDPEETHSRNRKEAEGVRPSGLTTSETDGAATTTTSKRKSKGLNEKSNEVSESLPKEKRKGKQRAAFVVGKVRENPSDRLAEERTNMAAGVERKLGGAIPDGAEDTDPGRPGASGTTLEGSIHEDSEEMTLQTSLSQSNRLQASERLGSSEIRSDSSCCDYRDATDASRKQSQSAAASAKRSQSRAASMMSGQSTAVSMMRTQSPALSMMKSPTVVLTDGQLALKVATNETSAVNHVNWDGSSTVGGVRRGSQALSDRQGPGRVARAEQRRVEVERRRAEKEEQRRRQLQKEETEERMKEELQREQEQRVEMLRQKKQQEEEERHLQEELEKERVTKIQVEREKERRRQVEKKRQMERFIKIRQEEEERRAVEIERLRVEEEQRMEEERIKLQEMEEDEREAYLLQRQREEEQRRREAEERKRREGEEAIAKQEALLQLARERAALGQRLKFRRALQEEADALELAQSVSRPWVYSYYRLLNILGIQDHPTDPENPPGDSH